MFEGVALRTFVPLLLRVALAAVFIYHGLEKVRPDNSYGLKWADKMGAKTPPILQNAPPVQALVAWGELLGGVAVALGLLTRIAAVGLLIIMVGAIMTFTGEQGFSPAGGGGYEYNFVLILVAAALALSGAGTFSLDRVVRLKMRGPAKY
jgi:putative oxidoreductase